jgi:hypothetical protein
MKIIYSVAFVWFVSCATIMTLAARKHLRDRKAARRRANMAIVRPYAEPREGWIQ